MTKEERDDFLEYSYIRIDYKGTVQRFKLKDLATLFIWKTLEPPEKETS